MGHKCHGKYGIHDAFLLKDGLVKLLDFFFFMYTCLCVCVCVCMCVRERERETGRFQGNVKKNKYIMYQVVHVGPATSLWTTLQTIIYKYNRQ